MKMNNAAIACLAASLTTTISLAGTAIPAAAEISVTDVTGRTVTLEKPATRVVLSEGRYITTLALLDRENPIKRVVGMLNDLNRGNPNLARELTAKYPAFSEIELFGLQNAESVSVEKILTLKPDLAIFGIHDHGPGASNSEVIDILTSAGIAIAFIDFRMNPLEHTIPSIRLLGKLLGREKQAEEYISFYEQRRNHIKQKVAALEGPRPKVFLHVHVGRFDCCVAMASGMLGPFITVAGGENIADQKALGPTSKHTMEFLITENPDVWIGTASGTLADYKAGRPMILLGSDATPASAKATLNTAIKQLPGFQNMAAYKTGRSHGIWHNYYNSPFNIVALEAFAKWLHPETFRDLYPEQTMKDIYKKFLPLTLNGVYTVDLAPAKSTAESR